MSDLTTSDLIKGISLSILSTVFGAASKLAIRKSWLIEAPLHRSEDGALNVLPGAIPEIPDSRLPEDLEREERAIRRKARCCRCGGLLGMAVLNPLCGVLAAGCASPSITAPFSGMTLVWVVLFAERLIGEGPTLTQALAAAVIVVGEVVAAVFGDHTNDGLGSLEDLIASYLEPFFIAYCGFIILWMLLLTYWMACSSSPLLQRFAWGASGGSVTGMQNFLKDTMIILKAGQGFPWYLAVNGLMTVVVALGGLMLLTACMKRYDAAYSSSMFVGSYILSTSIMSAAHYHTFEHLKGLQNDFLYPAGLMIIMAGVAILVMVQSSHEDDTTQPPSGGQRVKRKQSYEMVPRRRLDS